MDPTFCSQKYYDYCVQKNNLSSSLYVDPLVELTDRIFYYSDYKGMFPDDRGEYCNMEGICSDLPYASDNYYRIYMPGDLNVELLIPSPTSFNLDEFSDLNLKTKAYNFGCALFVDNIGRDSYGCFKYTNPQKNTSKELVYQEAGFVFDDAAHPRRASYPFRVYLNESAFNTGSHNLYQKAYSYFRLSSNFTYKYRCIKNRGSEDKEIASFSIIPSGKKEIFVINYKNIKKSPEASSEEFNDLITLLKWSVGDIDINKLIKNN
jgi:hypothetical protein